MKKYIFAKLCLLLAISFAVAMFTFCTKDDDSDGGGSNRGIAEPTITTDPGVKINGVTWATRNVEDVGTFADTPESPGCFFQWNRKTAWSATTPEADIAIGEAGGWDNTVPEGTAWLKANDPSPLGWRIPTLDEIRSLLDTDKVSNEWITQNGVVGRKFTDKTTNASLFLPAAGYRLRENGMLSNAGVYGFYWSSAQYEGYPGTHACSLYFEDSFAASWHGDNRHRGQLVRSVVE
ncbi:MAG: fibrobacter succinogenes major paralogous domain-containing protein [Prevotellaceae bacterium]|jgi:uncharacterized protein (TIGR02145 family)|nr:fibrobacter succinogenes major paralogous domain-containing protein [Prevotellaceae bacterium]